MRLHADACGYSRVLRKVNPRIRFALLRGAPL
jgi:hypothetical protein